MTRYFRRTTARAVAAILKGGFKDGKGTYLRAYIFTDMATRG